ncbi:hypothetical protein KC19_6G036100 [Ceratodon purpureus]|uniref:Uncharacterized protein n=1 Tax=Ceratodon purpureus TaxID=3225 RepID=A0A8T0HDC2_CERPU|nr:hypothetical protein KC19_6G036100 [Ceratodon purpureus]
MMYQSNYCHSNFHSAMKYRPNPTIEVCKSYLKAYHCYPLPTGKAEVVLVLTNCNHLDLITRVTLEHVPKIQVPPLGCNLRGIVCNCFTYVYWSRAILGD